MKLPRIKRFSQRAPGCVSVVPSHGSPGQIDDHGAARQGAVCEDAVREGAVGAVPARASAACAAFG